jgi:hypothetical protein
MQKLTNFALGEGEIATRRLAEAQAAMNTKVEEAAAKFVDLQGNLNQNKDDVKAWAEAQAKESGDATDSWKDYWDGQSFSMEKYLDDLEAQVVAAANWKTNLSKISGQLAPAVYDQVVAMGEAGSALVAGLTDGINDKEEIDRLNKAGATSANALYTGAKTALDGKPPLTLPYANRPDGARGGPTKKDGGFIGRYAMGGFVSGAGTARSDSIPAMLSNGEYVVNARATAQNRQMLEAINSNKTVSTAPNIYLTVNPSAGMDERELAEIVSRKIAFEIRKGRY